MITKFLLILVSALSIWLIYSNTKPVSAQVFDWCDQTGGFGPCSCSTAGCNGLQYAPGVDSITGVACTVTQSCNTTPNTDSCSCGAPNHNLVTCVSGALCTGPLGDGCNYCVGQPGNPTPTSGPGPTSTPGPTFPPPPPPTSDHISCKFTNGWNIQHTVQSTTTTVSDTNGISYYYPNESPQLDVTMKENSGSCWTQGASVAEILQLGPGDSCGLGIGTPVASGIQAANFLGQGGNNGPCQNPNPKDPTDPILKDSSGNDTNCINKDNSGTRDRTTSGWPSTFGLGTYCMRFYKGGHADSNCGPYADTNAFCEFTVESPPTTPTPSPTPTPIPSTCSITSTTENVWSMGGGYIGITNDLTVKYTGTPNLTNLWFERKDGAAASNIYSSQPGLTVTDWVYSGKHYYKVGTCNGGASCSVDVATPTDLGDYYLWCDNVVQPPAPASTYGCSGNPNCTYKNSSSTAVNCGSNFYSCSSLDNRVPISGSITNNGSPLENAPINNSSANYSQCFVRPPYTGGSTLGSTDDNGYFLIDNILVNQSFCIRPDIIPGFSQPITSPSFGEYNNNLASIGIFNPTSYECQLPGGKHTGNCTPTINYSIYDVTLDNSYNFVENILATPTPTPPPLTLGSCSLTSSNGQFYIYKPVTWTANAPGGGTPGDIYQYQWFDNTPGSGAAPPPSPKGLPAVWNTQYPIPETVNASVTMSDLTNPSLTPITKTCQSATITTPSSFNIKGDVHSNK